MKLSNPLTRKWKWNFTALSFAFPCVGMLVVMLISGYIPFGKTSMLYSDMYHQYYPFSWPSAAACGRGRACSTTGPSAWAWTTWGSSPIIWQAP